MEAIFGSSNKGRPTVIHCNHEYTKHRDNANGSTAWRCIKSVQYHCKARLTTRGPQIINIQNEQHTHEGNVSIARARKAIANMKSAMDGIGFNKLHTVIVIAFTKFTIQTSTVIAFI